MTVQVFVENIKCGGCANSIRKQLQTLKGVESVDVDVEQGQVTVELAEGIDAEGFLQRSAGSAIKDGVSRNRFGGRLKGRRGESEIVCLVCGWANVGRQLIHLLLNIKNKIS